MTKQIFKQIIWLLCITAAVSACKEKVEVVEVVRAIKTVTVKEQATEKIFKFSGQVAAVDSSGLSFEVGGQVKTVKVDIGNPVKKGKLNKKISPVASKNFWGCVLTKAMS